MATGLTGSSQEGRRTAGEGSSTLGKSGIKLSTQIHSNLGLSLVSHIWCVDKHCLAHMAKIIHRTMRPLYKHYFNEFYYK